ncbi:MAG: hypothetical protein L3J31_04840, partial [Bacteroidales bacterium]|nr:hypothetical protein [Bacteroidales bacterium]
VIYLGTNLFYYHTQKMCISHGYSFALLSVFLYSSIMWLKDHKLKWTIVMGLSAGIMVLIRPVDAVFFFFPLLFNVNSWQLFLERLKLFRKYSLHIIVIILLSFLVILPQLVYWKYVTGHFVFDSYSDEHFYFLTPNIFRAVFSYRNGWLIYSPILLFSIVGIFQLRRKLPKFYTAMVVIVPLYIYIISSWWCWWYAGFGNRAFINLYPLLSLPLAVFIQYVLKRKITIKIIFVIVFGGLILLNLFQTYQMTTGAIHWGSMSKAAYWDSFGRLRASQLFPSHLSWVDLKKTKKGNYVVLKAHYQTIIDEHIDFENIHETSFISLRLDKAKNGPSFSGLKSIHLPQNSLYALNVKFPLLDADEVYVTVWAKNNRDCAVVLTSAGSIPYYKATREYIHSKDDWKMLNIFARFTRVQNPDSLQFYIYNTRKNEMWFDDLHITTRKVSYHPETIEFNIF